MNYFDLINKCLVELNYKKCRTFVELTKNDHEKIKNILNIINAEVCSFDNWSFLLRKVQLNLPKNTGEILNTVPGKIHSIYIDGVKYDYYSDFEKFLLNNQPSNTYSSFNDKLLVPLFNQGKTIEVIYYTNQFAQDAGGKDIAKMDAETDVPVIPVPFVEQILVYGTCMRLKANPEHSKFSYWFGMYKEAIATLRSKIGTSALETPQIKLFRN